MAQVRRTLGIRRIGHAGTLDPFATGLLVVLIGRATRLTPFVVGLPKRYVGTLRLGTTTDTFDGTGTVTGSNDGWRALDDAAIRAAIDGLIGRYGQRPPPYSAKKVRGQPAHRRTRRGERVALAPHEVEVFTFTMTGRGGADVEFETKVSSGTYVRRLASDLGERLRCGAYLVTLRRTEVGPFAVTDAVPPDDVGPHLVRPSRDAVPHLPHVAVTAEERRRLASGRTIQRRDDAPGPVALLASDTLVGIAEPAGGDLRPRVVLTP